MLTKALHFPGIKQLAFSPVTSQLLSSWPQPLPYQTNNWKNLRNLRPIHCIPFSVPPPFTFFRCSQSVLVPCTASLPPISQQQCLQIQHKLRHVGTFIMKNSSKFPRSLCGFHILQTLGFSVRCIVHLEYKSLPAWCF